MKPRRTVKVALTTGEFAEYDSIASVGCVHLVNFRDKRLHGLVEDIAGSTISAYVSKRTGLAFLCGARSGKTLQRFAARWSEILLGLSDGEKYQNRPYNVRSNDEIEALSKLSKATYRACWFAPLRYLRKLENMK